MKLTEFYEIPPKWFTVQKLVQDLKTDLIQVYDFFYLNFFAGGWVNGKFLTEFKEKESVIMWCDSFAAIHFYQR
jgi:hypothetical protein